MTEAKEADVILSDGREIRFDMSKLSVGEWRSLTDPKKDPESEDAILEKVAGLKEGEIVELEFLEWRRLTAAFIKKASAPLDDPN